MQLNSPSASLGWAGRLQSGERKTRPHVTNVSVSFGRYVSSDTQQPSDRAVPHFGERTITPVAFLDFLAKNTDGMMARLQFQGLKLWTKLGAVQAMSVCGPLSETRTVMTARHEAAHALIASAVQTPPCGLFVYRLGRLAGGMIYPDRLHPPKNVEDFRRKLLVTVAGLATPRLMPEASISEAASSTQNEAAHRKQLARARKDICDFVETLRLGADRKWIRAGQDLESLPEDMDYETWGQLCEKMKKAADGKYPLSKGERAHYLEMKSAFSRAMEMPVLQEALQAVETALDAIPPATRTALVDAVAHQKLLDQSEWESILREKLPASVWEQVQAPLRAYLNPPKGVRKHA
jgi:hypothetical protein